LLPHDVFVQIQAGTEQPAHADIARARLIFARCWARVSARTRGLGRMWSPMLETISDRNFETGAKTNFDLVPQFQVTLSQRQHIRANIGWRFPVNNTSGRNSMLVFYLLWIGSMAACGKAGDENILHLAGCHSGLAGCGGEAQNPAAGVSDFRPLLCLS